MDFLKWILVRNKPYNKETMRNILEQYFTLKTQCMNIVSAIEPEFIITYFDVRFNEDAELTLKVNSPNRYVFYEFVYDRQNEVYFAYRYKIYNNELVFKDCGGYQITDDNYELTWLPTRGLNYYDNDNDEIIYYESEDSDSDDEINNEPEPIPEGW